MKKLIAALAWEGNTLYWKVLVMLLVLGCTRQITQVVAVLKFDDHRPMIEIPAVYAGWYADTEECLGESGDFSAINWYTATKIEFDGTADLGIIEYPDDITIKTGFIGWRFVVRHEMAHHISGPDREIHFDNNTRALCDGGVGPNLQNFE